jgi:hypothetical protein
MTDRERLTGRPPPPRSPGNPGRWDWQRVARPPVGLPAADRLRRRFNRTTGFWLGLALLGVGGCALGTCMPYHHPVALTISVLWWGIYLGCFGASIGALLGFWAEQMPAPPAPSDDGETSRNQTSRPWACSTCVSDRSARS